MKKIIALALLALAACDQPSQSVPPADDGTPVADPDVDECPRADGDECK